MDPQSTDTAYVLGRLFAPIFVGLAVAVCIRIFKKRMPTVKEGWIIVGVIFVCMVLAAIGRHAQ